MGILSHINNIPEYIKTYNTKIFIETGTGIGDTVEYAVGLNSFDKIYSIEMIEEIHEVAVDRFKDCKNVDILLSDSLEGLNRIMENIPNAEPIMFWLDAHFPGADFHLAEYEDEKRPQFRIPLEYELRVIKAKRPNSKDVFFIDDLRIYEDGPFLGGNWPLRSKIGGDGIGFIYELFEETHNIEKQYHDQGYIILTPKDK